MRKARPPRVQHEALVLPHRQPIPVEVVPQQRMAEVRRMHANLVRASGEYLDPHVCSVGEALQHGEAAVRLFPADLRRAVEMTDERAVLEASGRVTAETVAAIAQTGVNYISSGWITHSAPVLDFGLDFVIGTPSI